jgi:hypothetical protein
MTEVEVMFVQAEVVAVCRLVEHIISNVELSNICKWYSKMEDAESALGKLIAVT